MYKHIHDNVFDLVTEQERNYQSGDSSISEHVDWSLQENIETIHAYVNSKHTSGLYDSLGREKPFFNIGLATENIWYRATDVDRRNIRVKATKTEDYILAFTGNILLQDWMRKTNFGKFLNKWGRTLARYGSAMTKWVEVDGELKAIVVPWANLIVDEVNVDNAPIIEKIEYTPAQLIQNEAFDKEVVKDVLDNLKPRETSDGTTVDKKAHFATVFEVTGMMPTSYLLDDEDQDVEDEMVFSMQKHVISMDADGNEYTLFKGPISKNPYMITHLIEEDDRVMGIGAIEHTFEAQWMVNHSMKAAKDQLDLASKMIFQTANAALLEDNILTDVETGDVIFTKDPLTQVNNGSHDIGALQAYGQQWIEQSKSSSSTGEGIDGTLPPSGIAYRTLATVNRESHSLYELMTETKGLYLEDMLREYVLPHLEKQLNNKKEVVAVLESHDINFIDPIYIGSKTEELNKQAVTDVLLKGKLPIDVTQTGTEEEIKSQLSTFGNERGFRPDEIGEKTWKEMFDGFVWDLDAEITNENTDKEATVTTLSTVFQTVAANPLVLEDPNMKFLFGKILEETGRVSPLEIAQTTSRPAQTATPQSATSSLEALAAPTESP